MPPRDDQSPTRQPGDSQSIITQRKGKALVKHFQKPFSGGTRAISRSESNPSLESGRISEEHSSFRSRIEQPGASFGVQNDHAIDVYGKVSSVVLSGAHRQEPCSSANFLSLDRSQNDDLEERSPQIARQKANSDITTTMNNTGTFHDSNIPHIKQGDHGNVFNVSGGMVQHVNENGLSGAGLS
jgi:hypothetical protein